MGDPTLQALDRSHVGDLSFANVSILRLDKLGGAAPGNKAFKLKPFIERAEREDIRRLVSFGGAWSNHLHALAAIGAERNIETIGLVRAQAHEASTAMLADAEMAGMQIHRLGRDRYRRRNEPQYHRELVRRFGPCLIVPEGGAIPEAAAACEEITRLILSAVPQVRQIVLSVGTGTTMAGIINGLARYAQLSEAESLPAVHGISALRGADDLAERVQGLLLNQSGSELPLWQVHHGFHCGGFARVDGELRSFIRGFEAAHGIPLEPVYTGKGLLATDKLLASGGLDATQPTVFVHTGGLQGRRGYDF